MAPVGSDDARLLVLGSLPGEASLAAQRYYAHPQNQFWRLLGAAIGEELAGIAYEDRLARLSARRIALWDVVAEAVRKGSLDAAIRDPTANPLAEFVEAHPGVAAIAFNGQTAAKLGRRVLGPGGDRLQLIDLPSSSPAYTAPFDAKAARWAALGGLVSGGEAATLAG